MGTFEELISIAEQLPEGYIERLVQQAKVYQAQGAAGSPQVKPKPKQKRNVTPRPDCPYCASNKVVLDGKQCGKQRYWCKSCNRSFVPTTNTVMSQSHLSRSIWEQLVRDTFDGVSIDDSSYKLNLSHKTVFDMRHKILLALQYIDDQDPIELETCAELDETYVLESKKGSKLSGQSRAPRHRGSKASKRGISNEYVCVCAGVERNQGKAFAVTVNCASPSITEIDSAFKNHIKDGTVLFSDGKKGYKTLETSHDCIVHALTTAQMKASKTANLNNVNSFHSYYKRRYSDYRGVASKYINRYNIMFAKGFRNRQATIDQVCDLLFTSGVHSIHTTRVGIKSTKIFP